MKKIYTIIFCVLSAVALAQVGVNTTTPKAMFDVAASSSTSPVATDGMLIPRINVFPATNPTADQQGMLVYLTTTVGVYTPGFYYWDNVTTSWLGISNGGAATNWKLTGNTVVDSTSFVGTNNDVDLILKRNGFRAGRIGTTNTSYGLKALNPSTTGTHNVANGFQSLYSNTTGNRNVANGSFALYFNTTGTNNVANGNGALYNNTTGNNNVATGLQSLYYNTTGTNNVANGFQSLYYNTTGTSNVANGYQSLYSNTAGTNNVATGTSALFRNTTGNNNVATGSSALYFNTTGTNNVATGTSALYFNTTGNNNVANGWRSLYSNTIGNSNVATGDSALYSNTTGSFNIANGNGALHNNTTGNNNVANGSVALFNNTTGLSNVAIGLNAGSSLTTGSNNVFIGANTQPVFGTASNYININNQIYGNNGLIGIGEANPTRAKLVVNGNVNTNNGVYGSLRNTGVVATNAATSTPTSIWASDRIVASEFNATSDGRIKQNVVPVQNALSVLSKINVVNYTKLSKGGATNEIGIIAQELEKVLPQAVSQSEGDVYNALSKKWEVVNDFRTVNYQTITMLTAKALQELKQEVNEKTAEIKALHEKNKELELRLQKIEALMKK